MRSTAHVLQGTSTCLHMLLLHWHWKEKKKTLGIENRKTKTPNTDSKQSRQFGTPRAKEGEKKTFKRLSSQSLCISQRLVSSFKVTFLAIVAYTLQLASISMRPPIQLILDFPTSPVPWAMSISGQVFLPQAELIPVYLPFSPQCRAGDSSVLISTRSNRCW